jgi:acyl-CoA thioesterase I
MKPSILGLALALVAGTAAGQTPSSEQKPLGDYTLHEFAAKWMAAHDDLAELARYRDANRALTASADARPRVVLMGDSITFRWQPADLPPAPGLNLVNRGIPGQNTSQMLLRFEDDVIALKPAAVVIMGGTNDIRAYIGEPAAAGDAAVERVRRNVTAMADIADARRVKVVLAAVPPIGETRRFNRDPTAVVKINAWLKAFAAERGYPFVDHFVSLAGADGALPAGLSADGLHPNAAGYGRMRPGLGAALDGLRLTGGPATARSKAPR